MRFTLLLSGDRQALRGQRYGFTYQPPAKSNFAYGDIDGGAYRHDASPTSPDGAAADGTQYAVDVAPKELGSAPAPLPDQHGQCSSSLPAAPA